MADTYILGDEYRDRASATAQGDQFMKWINIPQSRMQNSPGIRPLPYTTLRPRAPAYLLLITHATKRSGNPWEDVVDLETGSIRYWGDAKYDPPEKSNRRVRPEQFKGNGVLSQVFDLVLTGRRELVPPILHFSKPRPGYVVFNGLCALEDLERTWFEDKGHPVINLRAQLAILHEQTVPLSWLHERATAETLTIRDKNCPESWRAYQRGALPRLNLWKALIRKRTQQLPDEKSPEAAILKQLVAMDPTLFEAAVVSLFRSMKDVIHSIERTRPSGDRGFDFFGEFALPRPLGYKIRFLGEAKRYGRKTAVTPGAVSRLVARLGRGDYGLFVTTSYFTEQAQEEVYSDRYPVRLISGGDLIEMMKELRAAARGTVSASWLQEVEREFDTRPWLREM